MPPKYRFGERSLSLEGLPRTKSRGKEWGAREKAKREKGEKRKLLVWWQQREEGGIFVLFRLADRCDAKKFTRKNTISSVKPVLEPVAIVSRDDFGPRSHSA
jgi:hypothetical protein